MPTIINNRSSLQTDPLRNFRFLVTFKPIGSTANPASSAISELSKAVSFGFTSVSGLAVTTDSIPYREGGYNTTVHQIPGQTTFAPVILQRGVILGSNQNWEWMRNLFATVSGGGSTRAASDNFRVDMEIAVLSHPVPSAGETPQDTPASSDHVAMRFNVYNAWPSSVAYSDLNAGDNALFVEQMTLVHEGFDVNWATALPATGKPNNAPVFPA